MISEYKSFPETIDFNEKYFEDEIKDKLFKEIAKKDMNEIVDKICKRLNSGEIDITNISMMKELTRRKILRMHEHETANKKLILEMLDEIANIEMNYFLNNYEEYVKNKKED